MSCVFDLVKDVFHGKQTWRLNIRIIRMWEMCPMDQPVNLFTIEMVMIDVEVRIGHLVMKYKSLMKTDEIMSTEGWSDYFDSCSSCKIISDMMGLLTVASSEKLSERSGRMTRFTILEFTDDRGKIKCTFFGDYIDIVNAYLAKECDELPVVVCKGEGTQGFP
ncbi:hypothetical protein SESBI_29235 [Sesbania bispinosa]|nr:hypothetical protein SESBI_29235 [Sesbania bispinosa]